VTRSAAHRPRVLPAAVLAFAGVSILWFGLNLAVLAQGIADGSMRDRTHLAFGYAGAAMEAVAIAGWLWGLLVSAWAASSVNGTVQVMCGATAAVQLANVVAMGLLMRGWSWEEPVGFLIAHAAVAVFLAILVGLSRRKRPVDGVG
jgi:hypothetical protein